MWLGFITKEDFFSKIFKKQAFQQKRNTTPPVFLIKSNDLASSPVFQEI